MLFTSPHYPLFLAAVFLLYGLSRSGRWPGVVARLALMTLLGDVVWLLLTHDVGTLWDPMGALAFGFLPEANFPAWWQLPIGAGALAAGVYAGVRGAAWLDGARGQRMLAAAILAIVVGMGVMVGVLAIAGELAPFTRVLSRGGHLAWLVGMGTALGAASTERGRALGRVLILMLVSCVFYHAWAAEQAGAYKYLLALIVFTIILDYYLALAIEASTSPARKKLLLVVSLVSNLGILSIFKYTDFFTQDVLHLPVEPLGLILPAGISFHTFQSLSYTIDVYKGQIKATRSITELATFVLFFPQLVAGPIVRASELLPQIHQLPPFDHARAADGLYRIVLGLFKKIAIGDFLALAIADPVFKDPSLYSSAEVACAVYAFSFRIYLDFSAYSDIAIGSAQLLGFELPENFRTPYRSASLQEFWRRWHISLSSWLRDYLYVPLGGNRGGDFETYRNLILTMFLGGLWHGASWCYIVWGLLHGGGLAVTRAYQRRVESGGVGGAQRMMAACAVMFGAGLAMHLAAREAGLWDTVWIDLALAWAYSVPLWAALTAWLAGGEAPTLRGSPRPGAALVARLLGAVAIVALFGVLREGASSWWLPLCFVAAALGWLADAAEQGGLDARNVPWLVWALRRGLGIVLVFHYVCLTWIFFRAQTFDGALAVLEQLALLEFDPDVHWANITPLVQLALVAAALSHFYAPRTLAWWRERFVAAPPVIQGAALAVAALVLRELAAPHIVQFIYFQY
jgi:alginate O-acetyltransferase complex protein AlgI